MTTINAEIFAGLAELYPVPKCELNFDNAFQAVVATVLSAQTTDARVNQITPALFAAWPDPAALAAAPAAQLAAVLQPLGLQHSKAERLLALASALLADHAGEVPADRQQLEALPGVGRKTANVVLANVFGIPALAVDTHVTRVAGRLGLVRATGSTKLTPRQIEDQLCAQLPEQEWSNVSHRLILHGRRVCTARRPACGSCLLAKLCPSAAQVAP